MKICVVGLGVVGRPTYEECVKVPSWDVVCYDVRKIPHIKVETKWIKVSDSDVFLINVPTSVVENVVQKIVGHSLVIIESTVQVGTCRKLSEKYSIQIAYCPHRFWAENTDEFGVKQVRVLGATNPETMVNALDFYKELHVPVISVSSLEITEMCKIVENSARYLQIAFAEQMKMICDDIGINFEELRKAVNSRLKPEEILKWNFPILEARDGIKGSCLPLAVNMLDEIITSENTSLLESAIRTDAKYIISKELKE